MTVPIGAISRVEIASDGWSAWVTIAGFGKNNATAQYNLGSASSPTLTLHVATTSYDAAGNPVAGVRNVLATKAVREPYPQNQAIEQKIVGEDLLVRVSLSEFITASETFTVASQPGWASITSGGTRLTSLSGEGGGAATINNSLIQPASEAPVAKFVTPDHELVHDFVYVEVIAGSAFATEGSEVAGVEFTVRDESGNSTKFFADHTTISQWGKGDVRPVSVYAGKISTAVFHDGDALTVSAAVVPHFGAKTVSVPVTASSSTSTAFVDQVFLLDKNGDFGKSYAYVNQTAQAGSGAANADPTLASQTPFQTIADAMKAVQIYNQAHYGRNNADGSEIRLMQGTHTWVGGTLTSSSVKTDDVWLTITKDPAASSSSVILTGSTTGKNNVAFADFIKVEDITIDRKPMGASTNPILKGDPSDRLWLHNISFDGTDKNAPSFSYENAWFTQSTFSNVGKALSTFGSNLNLFSFRGIQATSGTDQSINGHLLVGSDTSNIAIVFPTGQKMPGANGSVIAFNRMVDGEDRTILDIGANSEVRGIAVLDNDFGVGGTVRPIVSISADSHFYETSNIIFHHNDTHGARVNVGYNDVADKNYLKTLYSVKWNEFDQLNTKHDVFSKDADNTNAWSILYGVGFADNIIKATQASSAFQFAFDGFGSSIQGYTPPAIQSGVLSNPIPVAKADVLAWTEDTPASGNVLTNDSDPDGDPLTVKSFQVAGDTVTYAAGQSATIAGIGSMVILPNGSFTFTPAPNYAGAVPAITYAVTDGISLSNATLTLGPATAINDAPSAQAGQTQGAAGDIIRGFVTASDVDSPNLTYALASGPVDNAGKPVAGLTFNADGTYAFAAPAGVNGAVSFTYTASDGQLTSNSAGVAIRVYGSNSAPTGTVTIAGNARQGDTLTASQNLEDSDGRGDVSYQWLREGTIVTGATGATYTLTQADVGKSISVAASYRDGQGKLESVMSIVTSAIANVNDAAVGSVTISGRAEQNQVLRAVNTLSDADGLGVISYQWFRGADPLVGAVGSSFTLTQADVGKRISVAAIYTDGGGTAETVVSGATDTVANVNDAPTGTVTISGAPEAGQVLLASNSLLDQDGLGVMSYQWQRDGVVITGAASASYTLAAADVGKNITVSASYTDGFGHAEAVRSAAIVPRAAPIKLIITGTSGNDKISPSATVAGQPKPGAGNDTLIGLAGNDNLNGGPGDDTMYGGAGADIYTVDSLGDVVDETYGQSVDDGQIDKVMSSASFTLGAFVEQLTLTGTAAINGTGNELANLLTGNSGDNILYGAGGNDALNGGLGADIMRGGAGADSYVVDSSGDIVDEIFGQISDDAQIDKVSSSVSFTLPAFAEWLTLIGTEAINATGNELANNLTGNAGDNILAGFSGNDVLTGGAGNDVLDGGDGADTLKGGDGADIFVMGSPSFTGIDKVSDFAAGDKIGIRASDFQLSVGNGILANGLIDPGYFVSVTGKNSQGSAIGHGQFVFNTTSKTLMWDGDGAGSLAPVALATFNTTISQSNFMLI